VYAPAERADTPPYFYFILICTLRVPPGNLLKGSRDSMCIPTYNVM
jgi:hypothetical protein